METSIKRSALRLFAVATCFAISAAMSNAQNNKLSISSASLSKNNSKTLRLPKGEKLSIKSAWEISSISFDYEDESYAPSADKPLSVADSCSYDYTSHTLTGINSTQTDITPSCPVWIRSITVNYFGETETINIAPPAISTINNDSIFANSTDVSISAEDDCSIHYTTDNSEPITTSTTYSAPFTITSSCIISAIASKTNEFDETTTSRPTIKRLFKLTETDADTITFADLNLPNSQLVESIIAPSEILSSVSKGKTKSQYTNGALRLYKDCTLTIRSLWNIQSVKFIYQGKDNTPSVKKPVSVAEGTIYNYETHTLTDIDSTQTTITPANALWIKGMIVVYKMNEDKTPAPNPTISTPLFNMPSGEIEEGTAIVITAEDGLEIHYTTDGTTPTSESALYTQSIIVDENTTIKAISIDANGNSSEVATAIYTIYTPIAPKTPSISISSNDSIFAHTAEVSIIAEDNSNIYYTTDGTEPTTSSISYSAPFKINNTCTISAIATDDNNTELSTTATKHFIKLTETDADTIIFANLGLTDTQPIDNIIAPSEILSIRRYGSAKPQYNKGVLRLYKNCPLTIRSLWNIKSIKFVYQSKDKAPSAKKPLSTSEGTIYDYDTHTLTNIDSTAATITPANALWIKSIIVEYKKEQTISAFIGDCRGLEAGTPISLMLIDAVVTQTTDNGVYATDATGSIFFHGIGLEDQCEPGDVMFGMLNVIYDIEEGRHEVRPIENTDTGLDQLTIDTGASAIADTIQFADVEDYTEAYVCLNGYLKSGEEYYLVEDVNEEEEAGFIINNLFDINYESELVENEKTIVSGIILHHLTEDIDRYEILPMTITQDKTPIAVITTDKKANHAPMFNILGQRVNSNDKGIVIQNGKKSVNR